ncbi:hypothetical protein EGW08_007890 [Elysia chlorotica]|uniref:Uncharacterized protein n=1 Tax=Elysia chlorotica TaxID=188477 RepID=A0A433TS65_ELYCH|nr:hypothetical protein EGW08_007890 [Elysia chlorotica]
MAGSEPKAEQTRQPEAVSAARAEQRLSSRDGRPPTNHSASSRKSRTLLPNSRGSGAANGISSPRISISPQNPRLGTEPPENTPRALPAASGLEADPATTDTGKGDNQSGSENLTNNQSLVRSAENTEDNILEEDELFMTLTEEERNEWETMMSDRSKQLEQSLSQHQAWAEDFTKRRMFAYCRMRKLIASYASRGKFLSDVTSHLTQAAADRHAQAARKQGSDNTLFSPRTQKSSKSGHSASLSQTNNKVVGLMPSLPEDVPSLPSVTLLNKSLEAARGLHSAVPFAQCDAIEQESRSCKGTSLCLCLLLVVTLLNKSLEAARGLHSVCAFCSV